MKNEYLYIPCAHHPLTRRSIRSIVSTLARKATDVKVKRERERRRGARACMDGHGDWVQCRHTQLLKRQRQSTVGRAGRARERPAWSWSTTRGRSRAHRQGNPAPRQALRAKPPRLSQRESHPVAKPPSLSLSGAYISCLLTICISLP